MTLLRDMMGIHLSPLWNNIACALLTVVYVKMVMEMAIWIRSRLGTRDEARRLVHVALSSWIVFWPLFDPTDWSWRLNVLVPAVVATRLVYKGALIKDPDDEDIQTMSRSSSPSELLFGPLQMAILMVWVGLTQFMTEEAAIVMAAVGIGDGIAPLIGARYGRHMYRMPFSNVKTMEGSLCGVFLGTIAGCYFYPYMLGMPWFPLRMVLAYGGIAAVVEGTSPGHLDNIMLPLVMHFSIDHVDRWMPA